MNKEEKKSANIAFVIEIEGMHFEFVTTPHRWQIMAEPIAKALLHGFRAGSRGLADARMKIGKLKWEIHEAGQRHLRLLAALRKCQERVTGSRRS